MKHEFAPTIVPSMGVSLNEADDNTELDLPTPQEATITGTVEVLYRFTGGSNLPTVDSLDRKDYKMVWPRLTIQEFHSPIDILEALCADPPSYGPLPRPPKELDIIHLCPDNRRMMENGWPKFLNMVLVVVNTNGDMLSHLHTRHTIIQESDVTQALGLGLMLVPTTLDISEPTQTSGSDNR